MFKDRNDAAEQLSKQLEKFKNRNAVVVAIPRGGVPIGYRIARYLNLPLELVLSKKIGHPTNKEYAIGAVTLYGSILDASAKDVSESYIDSETSALRVLLMQRKIAYYGDKEMLNLENKEVILVDDGIATGNTLISCVGLVQQQHPSKIIVALPVAPYETLERIREQLPIDEIICLVESKNFYAVGQFYDNFEQVDDATVIRLMNEMSKIE